MLRRLYIILILFRLRFGCRLKLSKCTTFQAHAAEYAFIFGNQIKGRVKFDDLRDVTAMRKILGWYEQTNLALVQYDQAIIINNCPQTMCN